MPSMIGQYTIGRTLGTGSYGVVKSAKHAPTGKEVAIKCVPRLDLEESHLEALRQEIEIHRTLHHPHVVKLLEVMETEDCVYIVLEHASGGELFDLIVAKNRLREIEARRFFRQLMSGVQYLHVNGLVHRDLKPENLLLGPKHKLMISDFGFSVAIPENDLLRSFCGSPGYSAPEIVARQPYRGPPVDVWAMGVILYSLLVGRLPFEASSEKATCALIKQCRFDIPSTVSADARDLLQKILVVDPTARATLKDIRRHRWVMTGYDGPPSFSAAGTTLDVLAPAIDDATISEAARLSASTRDAMISDLMSAKPTHLSATFWLMSLSSPPNSPRIVRDKGKSATWGGHNAKTPPKRKTSHFSLDGLPKAPVTDFRIRTPSPPEDFATGSSGVNQLVGAASGGSSGSGSTTPRSPRSAQLSSSLPPNSKERLKGRPRRFSDLSGLGQSSMTSNLRVLSGPLSSDLTSSRPANDLMSEVKEAMAHSKIAYSGPGFSLDCADEAAGVRFYFELCKVEGLNMCAFHFKRVSGSFWEFRKVTAGIIAKVRM